jgi:hypothetical protein
MAVAALSTAGFSQYVAASSNLTASQQAFQALGQSLSSGNLTAAQTAFNAYQQINQQAASGSSSSTSSSTNSSTPSQFSTDLTALGSAISSGSLTTAQSAFATVQADLKAAPAPAVNNAESAVAQTVQWIDDLLNLSTSQNTSSTPVDPTTSILDSAYGLTPTTTTDPTTSLLDSAYGDGSTSTSGATSTPTASTTSTTNTSASAANGNNGSGATVNAYA